MSSNVTESGHQSDTRENSRQLENNNESEHQMGFFESSLNQWRNLKMDLSKTIRLIFIVAGLTAEILNNFIGFLLPTEGPECIEDKVFAATSSINTFFSEHSDFRKGLMIFSSLCIDIYILLTFFYYILFSKSTKFISSLLVYYILLIFIRRFFSNAVPSDFLFDYPGFPSLFVPYYKTSSFFYSSTIGILVFCSIEWSTAKFKRNLMMGIGIFFVIFESIFMMVLRKHFVCDIFTSVFLSHFLSIMAERYSDYIICDLIMKKCRQKGKNMNKNKK